MVLAKADAAPQGATQREASTSNHWRFFLDKIYPQFASSEEMYPCVTAPRNQVLHLPVDDEYRKELLLLIDTYNDQIISRLYYAASESWDDLKALQQFTLTSRNEGALRAMFAGNGSSDV